MRLSIAIGISLAVHALLFAALALLIILRAGGGELAGGESIGVWIESPGAAGVPTGSPGATARSQIPATAAAVQHPPAGPSMAAETARATAPTEGTGEASAGESSGGGVGSGKGEDQRLARIWRKINASKYYPASARHRGLVGVPRVTFAVGEDGGISGLTLASSCGIGELDEAALETVRRAAPLPTYPTPITLAIRYTLER
jgi:periplasmic protein TonB